MPSLPRRSKSYDPDGGKLLGASFRRSLTINAGDKKIAPHTTKASPLGFSLRSSSARREESIDEEDRGMHFSVGAEEEPSPRTAQPQMVSGAALMTGKGVVVGAVSAGAHAVVETGKVVLETGRAAGNLGKEAARATGDAMLTTGKVATGAVLTSGRAATGAFVVTGRLATDAVVVTGRVATGAVVGTGNLALSASRAAAGAVVITSTTAGDLVVGGVLQTGKLGLAAGQVAGKAVVGTGTLATSAVVSTGKMAGKALANTSQLVRSGTEELGKDICKSFAMITNKVRRGNLVDKEYVGPGSVLDLEQFDQFISQVLCTEIEEVECLAALDECLSMPLKYYHEILHRMEVGLTELLSFHHELSDCLKCEMHTYLGLVYLEQRNHSAAVDTLTKALWYQSKSPTDKLGVALANHRLGVAYGRKRNYELALGLIGRAIEVYESEDAPADIYVAAKSDRHEFLEQEQLALLLKKRPHEIRRTVSESVATVANTAPSRRSIRRSQSIRASHKLRRCRSGLHKRAQMGQSTLARMEESLKSNSCEGSHRISRSQRIASNQMGESIRSTDGGRRECTLRSSGLRMKDSSLRISQSGRSRTQLPPLFKQLTSPTA